MHGYHSVFTESECEKVIERSRFIARCAHAEGEEQARAFVARVRAQHSLATHNCFAFVIGENQELQQEILDRAAEKGKTGNRNKIVLIICLAITVEAVLVAVDGLGSNGLWVPGQATFGINNWNDNWLDFMDMMSEGIAMPLGALLMSLMVGYEIKSKTVLDEVRNGCSTKIDFFYNLCIKVITPIGMILVLLGQLNDFGFIHIFD